MCFIGGSGSGSWRWGVGERNSLLRVRYTIVLLKSVIKVCVEDLINHAITKELLMKACLRISTCWLKMS